MKKLGILCLSILGSFSLLTACGEAGSEKNAENSETSAAEESKSEKESKSTTTKATTTSKSTTKTTTKATTTAKVQKVALIGDRSVDYDEANNQHRVFWAFSDEDKVRMTANADITIIITNDDGQEVYNKTIHVTSSDYTTWTNKMWDEPKLMGCIYIPDSEIEGGSTSSGKLSLSAKTSDGGSFDPEIMNINDLPAADFILNLPSTPLTINNYDWHDNIDLTINIKSIEYEYENKYSDKLILKFMVEMTYNSEGNNHSDISKIGYKLKNSSGVIVDSGTFYVSSMAVGDVMMEEESIYDKTKAGEAYTLELIDTDN